MAMLLLSVMGVMAQEQESPVGKFSLIPYVGVGLSNWSNCSRNYADEMSVKSKYQAGFIGGVDVEYRATKEVGVSVGVNFAQQGFKFPSYQTETKASNGETVLDGFNNNHVKLNYIQVPLLVRAYVTNHLSLMLGAQVGFLCGDGKLKMDYTKATLRNDVVETSETETITSDWPTKKVNVSIPIGIAYEYMGVILNARYNLGLVNVSGMSDVQPSAKENYKNNGFVLTVGYRFTL